MVEAEEAIVVSILMREANLSALDSFGWVRLFLTSMFVYLTSFNLLSCSADPVGLYRGRRPSKRNGEGDVMFLYYVLVSVLLAYVSRGRLYAAKCKIV